MRRAPLPSLHRVPHRQQLASAALVLGALVTPHRAFTAEPIADPTRPPAALLPTPPRPATSGTGAPAPRPVAPPPVLQAVLRPAIGPATALIDGRVVQVGEAVSDWTVHAIEPDAVLLRRGNRQLRLPLLAGLNNPPAAPPMPTAPGPSAVSTGPATPRADTPDATPDAAPDATPDAAPGAAPGESRTSANPLALALPKEP